MTQAGNANIERLYRDHYHALKITLWRCDDRCNYDPEDIIQEVFIKCLRRDSFEALEQPRAYLYKMCCNHLKDKLKHGKIRNNFQCDLHDRVTMWDHCGESPERQLEAQEIMHHKLKAIERLPTKMRVVFTLFTFKGYSHKEIAQIVGISTACVEKHIMRAKQIFAVVGDLR